MAFVGVLHAEAIVQAIDKQNAAFEIQPPAEVRVRIQKCIPLGAGMWEWVGV